MPAARRAHVFAHELPRLGIEEPDDEIGPLHIQALADPAWRGAVVRGLDFDASVEVHGARAVAVVAKGLQGERA